ncbi:DUF6998 domain-containing protein [Azonexus sp.]|uniref:DUF6998 domain-containing protein n=1 Tax=Azonexus sp. TaxID=1872668 RepID=UPI0039E6D219
MALSQMQLIQSLGEAMSWFERELGWGVKPTEMPHLCGRIGELYVALITNGQMAPEVNQRGYDVVSAQGERISVKTTARSGFSNFQVFFTGSSLEFVDRVIVLWMNTEEMQIEILLDAQKTDVLPLLSPVGKGKLRLGLSKNRNKSAALRQADIPSVNEVRFKGYTVRELESGTIEVEHNGNPVQPVKPCLRDIAGLLNVGLLNSKGNAFNTRQLGTQIIQSILQLNASQILENRK